MDLIKYALTGRQMQAIKKSGRLYEKIADQFFVAGMKPESETAFNRANNCYSMLSSKQYNSVKC